MLKYTGKAAWAPCRPWVTVLQSDIRNRARSLRALFLVNNIYWPSFAARARIALPRWLILFFSSGSSWAVVQPYSGR